MRIRKLKRPAPMLTEFVDWPFGVVPRNKQGRRRRGYTVDDNGCWIYCGFKDRNGYGRKSLKPRNGSRKLPQTTSASRFFFERWVGPIPDGYELVHTCLTRSCVRPTHTRFLTHHDNMVLVNQRIEGIYV